MRPVAQSALLPVEYLSEQLRGWGLGGGDLRWLIVYGRVPRSVSDGCCPLARSVALTRGVALVVLELEAIVLATGARALGRLLHGPRVCLFTCSNVQIQPGNCRGGDRMFAIFVLTSVQRVAQSYCVVFALWCSSSRKREIEGRGKSVRLTGPVNLRRRVAQSEMRPNPCRAKIL